MKSHVTWLPPHRDTLCAGSLRGLVRQLSIDQFENEGRRVMTDPSPGPGNGHSPMFERAGVHQRAVCSPPAFSSRASFMWCHASMSTSYEPFLLHPDSGVPQTLQRTILLAACFQ